MNTNRYLRYDELLYKKVIKKLLYLKLKISNEGCHQDRANFVCMILDYFLFDELKSEHGLLAQNNLTSRDFDTCFEMLDSEKVVYEIMSKAQVDPNLLEAIREQLGNATYTDWYKTYKAQPEHQTTLF